MTGQTIHEQIEAEFRAGTDPTQRRALLARLRGDQEARELWDRSAELFRVLEDAEVSSVELEQVERWLIEDLDPEPEPETITSRLRRWLARPRWYVLGGLATAAAMLVLLLPRSPEDGEPVQTEGWWAARGLTQARPLGLDAVCGRPAHAAAEHGCRLDERLAFSMRWPEQGADGGALARGHLSVFGIDEAGELLYYAPTPVDGPLAIDRQPPASGDEAWDAWRSLGFAVNLAVNHEPGRVRVYALLSPHAPKLAAIEQLAVALRNAEPAEPGAPAWHRRLSQRELAGLCAEPRRCASAELSFVITEGEKK